ncbi:MAG: ACT domain-containing protein [Candidatus Dormibacteria bacterium]
MVLPEEMQAMTPYLGLAEKLGSLYAQAGGGGARRVELEISGSLSRHDSSYLTAEVIKGMLSPFTEERINVVNARLQAQARGIEVVEKRTDAQGLYPDLLSLRVDGSGPEFRAAGTVLAHGARLVRLGDFHVDVEPAGRFLLTYHDDRPGIIGSVGMALGERNINIAALQLGRDAPRGRAVMIVAVDDDVPESVREELARIDGMTEIRYVHL